jgi:hypothetical protein
MADDGTLAPGMFYADYPLWTLYDAALGQGKAGIPQINGPNMEPFLAIFTDVDLAKRFIEDLRRPDVEPVALREPKAVLAILEHFQQKGIKHVGLDFSFHPGGVHLHPIGEFIEDVRRSTA